MFLHTKWYKKQIKLYLSISYQCCYVLYSYKYDVCMFLNPTTEYDTLHGFFNYFKVSSNRLMDIAIVEAACGTCPRWSVVTFFFIVLVSGYFNLVEKSITTSFENYQGCHYREAAFCRHYEEVPI